MHTLEKFLKINVSIAFLLFFSLSAQAQKYTVSGTVESSADGETLLGATIFLQGTSYGATTNEYGFFSLTAPEGDYALVVSYIGFQSISKNISLNQDLKMDFELTEEANLLEEVVVSTDQVSKVDLRSPQTGLNNLTVKEIKQVPVVLGEVDVLKSIQMLPGVTSNGEGAVGFNVRGGAVDQNLVLLDEATIYNTSHLFGFFSVFNADAIKDINLYKGDIPAQFGGRVSSVLDVRQKDGDNKKFGGTGGIGLISSRLALEGPLVKDKGSFIVAGRTSYAHLFLNAMDDFQDDHISFYDLNLKSNYKLNDKNRLFLSGYFGRDKMTLGGVIDNNYGNISGNLRWNHILNDRLFSNLSLIYSKYDYQFIFDFIEMDWVSDIVNYNLKYDFSYYTSDALTLKFGASTIAHRLNPGAITPSTETSAINPIELDINRALESGLYISAEHRIAEKLTASYGLRYSHFNRFGGQELSIYENNLPVIFNQETQVYEKGITASIEYIDRDETIKDYGNFEPRLGLAWQINDSTSIKASYNRNAQYMHLLSNTTNVTPVDVWTPSGEYMKPQLSDQFSLGYFKNFLDQEYSLELEGYYKTVANRIDYIDGASLIGNNTIENEILNGESRAYGMELLLRKNRGNLTGWLAYTLSKSEQRTLGGNAGGPGINNGDWYNTPYDRTHDISATAAYQLSNKWSIGLNGVFQTGRPVSYPIGQYEYEGLSVAHYDGRNEERLPAYHRLDLSATYTPRPNKTGRWRGEWQFSLYNVYNRKNAASISFGQNAETGLNEATRVSIFGIIPSVTYNFKF
ncbi:MAG: hypothetical protein CML04_01395 [Pseudozobellia sp.]|nr:hypothetical protein [Pseudozobellia sp.]MBG48839.1 hypothetical protein [Pseudozobellia sp.]